MIHNVFPIVANELNAFLQSRYNAVEDKVIISNIIDQDGSLAVEGSNKIVMSLINVEQEGSTKASMNQHMISSSYVEYAPHVSVNLTILFSAFFNSKNYLEALRFLSGVIYFFQSKPLFTPQNSPSLSDNIEKLHFDLLTIPLQELMNIYTLMGAKYMPSAVYKMKMLTFNQENIIDEIPAIKGSDFKF